MRINHNIAALNTYRQLSTNSANGSKALEKLSSGLRINKAGDDAAGLAISEKMRAQIRGLDQASRNAQDGISMIQTAEGALNETHSILQRMRELADQSANDTNVGVDREEIQKEINQLTSEINRIGNTTEFNTQRLLDGGTTKTAVSTATKGVALSTGSASITIHTNSAPSTTTGALSGASSTPGVAASVGTQGYTEFEITTALADGDVIVVGGQTITTYADTAARTAANAGAGDAYGILATDDAATQAAAIRGMTFADLTASGAGSTVRLSQTVNGTGDVTAADIAGVTGGGAVGNIATQAGAAAGPGVQGVSSFTINTPLAAGESFTVAGATITTYADAAVRTAANAGAGDAYGILATDDAATQAAAIRGMTFAGRTTGGAGAAVTISQAVNGTGDVTVASVVTSATPSVAGDYSLKIDKMFAAGEQITFGGQTFKAVASGANAANGEFNVGTSTASQAESLKAAIVANSTLNGSYNVTVKDGTINLVEKSSSGTDLSLTKVGNAEGTINFKHVGQGNKGTAAVWNTGAVAALGDNATGSFTFNGVTVNINSAAAAVGVSSNAATKSVSITIQNGSTADSDTATAILAALNDYKTNGGTELADFTFGGDENGITITDKKETTTNIATNGDNNNGLIIGATGAVGITNNTNATQLTTVGKDAVQAKYTFDITNAFKANETIEIGNMTFKGVTGEANALLGEFSIDGNKADQAASLKAAIEANTALNNRYSVEVQDAKLTLVEKVAGQETSALTAPTTKLTAATSGAYAFEAQTIKAGEVYNIDGVEIKAVSDAEKYRDDLAAGKAMLVADNVNNQAENLRRAINANATLSAKYTATGTDAIIQLTQKAGAETSNEPTITVGKQGANGKFVANFQIGANTGQSMTVEVNDMRSVALKVSGSESAASVTAKNGRVASYVSVANVSNGTDNTSVEYALDVSSHEKATAAISVINDAIEAVSAQRSQLGAYQNRLEHTINNLGTSSENMTAAESRIRDVDYAEAA